MGVYWVSFHIHSGLAGGKTYDDRYGSLDAAIKKECPSVNNRWDKTSSFVVFKSSNNNCADLARKLSAGLNRGHDIMLLRKMESKSAAIFGLNKASNLVNLMLDGDTSYLIDITPPIVRPAS